MAFFWLAPEHMATENFYESYFAIVALLFFAVWVLAATYVPARIGIAVLGLAMYGLILNYATIYLDHGSAANWGVKLSHTDALYVTIGNFVTAGSPGIAPQTEFARRLVTAQYAIDIIATVALFGLLVARIADRRPDWLYTTPTAQDAPEDAPLAEGEASPRAEP
jgi:hypothetical protein